MQNRSGHAFSRNGVIARQDDRELVAAEARYGIGSPLEHLLQPRRDGTQYPVADRMPERVVHVLEVIEVHQQDRDVRIAALGSGDGLIEAVVAQRAIGQLRQGIAVGEIHDPRFTARDAVLHGAECRGQVAELDHGGRRRRLRVVARGDAPSHARELADRTSDPARDADARQDGHEDTGERNKGEPALQAPERFQRRGDRLLEHGDDGFAAARGQSDDTGHGLAAVLRVAVGVAVGETLCRKLGQKLCALFRGQRARLQPPAIARLAAEERHVETCQTAKVLAQAVIDIKADRHPGDRCGRQHRDHDELVEPAADQHHRRSLLRGFGVRDELRKRKCLAGPGVERITQYPLVQTDNHHQRSIDTPAVLRDHRCDRLPVAARDHFAERVVG